MFLKQFSRLLKPSILGAFTEPLKRLPALAAAPASRWNPAFALNNPLRWNSSGAVVPLADKSTTEAVNKQLETGTEGRLFAVVQLCGKQFKITTGDIIVVEGYWPPENGDRLRLDKVLLAGGSDFSLIGRPLLAPGLVDVQATIVEKTLSHTRTHFRKKRRKQYMRINFYRSQQTMIRINSIEITRKLANSAGAPEASGDRFF
uniref:Large ribosomal subunit protein bL21m n=1 Tax=Anopheles braziliensis TaxID=58242 RepID=A0A2M3ZJ80_9DIPT